MLKYMVQAVKDDNVRIIRRLRTDDDVNEPVFHGDHLTFGLIARRNGDIIVKSHWTSYNDFTIEPYVFDRSTVECNFTLGDIDKISCEDKHGYDGRSVTSVIRHLCCVAMMKRGGAAGSKKRHRVRCVASDFYREEFVTFLTQEVFDVLIDKRELETIQVMYAKKMLIVLTDYTHPVRYVYYMNAPKTLRAFRAWVRVTRGLKPGPVQQRYLDQLRAEIAA